MFEHIGRKAKAFAKALFWIGAIASGILGFVAAIKADSALLFPLITLLGSASAYLSVIVLYVIAQLADNSDILAENSRKQLEALHALQDLLQKSPPCNAAAQASAINAPAGEATSQPTPPAGPAPAQQTEETPAAAAESQAEEPAQAESQTEEPTKAESQSEEPAQAESQAEEPAQAERAQQTDESQTDAPHADAAGQQPEKVCRVCGFGLTNDIFCPNCGTKVGAQIEPDEPDEPDGLCPGCGYSKAFGKFCPRCGLLLRSN